jgi:hypothetical protein
MCCAQTWGLLAEHTCCPCRSALWALFIPADLSSGVQDVWRGYWAQRLLSDMGGHLLYVGQQGSSPTPPIGEGAAHQVLEELQVGARHLPGTAQSCGSTLLLPVCL